MPDTRRATVNLHGALHRVLVRRAAETGRSIEELVEDAVRADLDEVATDLAAVEERKDEPTRPFEAYLASETASEAECLLAMERAALDRWAVGDPSGFLEISAPDVTYFDSFLERRLNGIEELSRYYESLRGKVRVDRYELVDPRVAVLDDVAVLTFNYVSWTGTAESRWNSTEAYRRTPDGWLIFQTHWSRTGTVRPLP